MKDFCDSIANILLENKELISKVKNIRDILREKITLDEFKISCIEAILDSFDNYNNEDNNWSAPTIYFDQKLRYCVRLIFWPAFYENNPHKHKTWSITGIFHNRLDINTYEFLESPARLKKEKTIVASESEIGFLLPGCIHNVSNPTHELSCSIHIFNNIADNSEDNAIWYPGPRKHNLGNGSVERALTICVLVLSKIKNERSKELLKRIFEQSSFNIKFQVIKSMYVFDSSLANKYFNKLEVEC